MDYLPRMKMQGGLGLGIAFPKTVVWPPILLIEVILLAKGMGLG